MFKQKEVQKMSLGFVILSTVLFFLSLVFWTMEGVVSERLLFIGIGFGIFGPFTMLSSYLIGNVSWKMFDTNTEPTPIEQSLIDRIRNYFKDFEKREATRQQIKKLKEMLDDLTTKLELRLQEEYNEYN